MFSLKVDHELELCLLEEHHAGQLFSLIEANRAYLRRWLNWVDSNTAVDDSLEFIKSTRRQFAENRGFTAGIFYQGRLVGLMGSHSVDWLNRVVEFGYWLAADFQGRGVVTRACRAALGYFFDELGLNRVVIRCAIGNHRSCAIPKRLGFTHEGVLRQAEWLNGHYVDHNLFSLLAAEWEKQK